MRKTWGHHTWSFLFVAFLIHSPLAANDELDAMALTSLPEKIVNGLWTQAEPTTAAIIASDFDDFFCSGTLVGCQTVITAAHCVCAGTGADCQGENAPSSDGLAVFLQHAGRVDVESVAVPPNYDFGVAGDIAVLKLAEPVTGLRPTPINDRANIAAGTPTTLAGFGTDASAGGGVSGIKRTVAARTQACNGFVPGSQHVCYQFSSPVGPAGEDGSSCFGDSGGPTFAFVEGEKVLAGVTSGGSSCTPPGAFGFDTNVYANRDWLRAQIGADLHPASCGALPTIGGGDTSVRAFRGYVHPADSVRNDSFEVDAGVQKLRLTINSGALPGPQVRAFLRRGSEPSDESFDCMAFNFDGCEIDQPQSGTWHLRVEGSGDFQATVNLFYAAGSDAGDGALPAPADPTDFCVPSLATMCIDDDDFDRRFELEVSYATELGNGGADPAYFLPVNAPLRGGLMWFFTPDNPEMLVKVLNGCAINDHFWVFTSAATTVGYEIKVTDRSTGEVYRVRNSDGQQAQPVSDIEAFACGGSS